MALSSIHLCSGYGGFELALRSVARVRTVAHVERDAYAAAVLVERMGQARLDHAPVWDDLTTFDGKPWRGRVDLITAGFPCQPFSSAGQQRGIDDDRWLWPAIASIVADVGPEFVLLENVPQLVRLGLPHVLHDLADLGFDAEWGLLSAAAVGAPHRRERIWIVAHAEGNGRARQRDAIGREGGGTAAQGRGQAVADADRNRREAVGRGIDLGCHVDGRHGADVGHPHHDAWRCGWLQQQGGADTPNAGEDVADTTSLGGTSWVGPEARHGWPAAEAGHWCWPPGRDDLDGWQRWIAHGGPEPVLRRDVDGPPDGLADALHLGGNGLVPQAAAHAIRQLLERGGWELR